MNQELLTAFQEIGLISMTTAVEFQINHTQMYFDLTREQVLSDARQALTEGQELFNEKGGAIGHYEVDDTVCALGALCQASRSLGVSSDITDVASAILSKVAIDVYKDEIAARNEIRQKSGQMVYIVSVVAANDLLGVDAVKHCYEQAIKWVDAELEGGKTDGDVLSP